MRLVVRPVARRDILLQVGYHIDELSFDAAERFPVAVLAALEEIRQRPNAGSPRIIGNPKLRGLRSWPMAGFEDFRVYYVRPAPNLIRVIRVLHGKRDIGRIPADQ